MDEADVPTQRAQARQDTRFPEADVDQGRTGGHQGPSGEGTPAPVGVTPGRPHRPGVTAVRARETFADLRRSSLRGRSGPLSVSFVARPEWDRSQVAYAVSRKVGNAVERNRLRRRLRAIVADRAADLPVGAYQVRSTAGGPDLDFDELKVAMSQALDKATSRSPERMGR